MIWPGVRGAIAGRERSIPVIVRGVALMLFGGPPGPGAWNRPPPLCVGTVPSMCTDVNVNEPDADLTPSRARIFATSVWVKLSCDAETKSSREKWLPGFPRPCNPNRAPPFSFWSCCLSVAESPAGPLLPNLIGRVTERSVPMPVSGASTLACARSRPVESAPTVTTTPIPSARPSAVRTVRPLRRRSSLNMYET